MGGIAPEEFPEVGVGVASEVPEVGDLCCPYIEGVKTLLCCSAEGTYGCVLLLAVVAPPLDGAIPMSPDSKKTMPRIAAIVLTVRTIPRTKEGRDCRLARAWSGIGARGCTGAGRVTTLSAGSTNERGSVGCDRARNRTPVSRSPASVC